MRGLENVVAASFAVALCMVMGCGGSDDTDESNSKSSSSKSGRADGGSAGGNAPLSIQPLPDNTAGKTCETDGDCATGMCLKSIPGSFGSPAMDAPGGYCSGSCTTNADCGEGGACSGAIPSFAGSAATPGSCLKDCKTAEDCRQGYRCVNGLGMAPSNNPMDPIAAFLGSNVCQPVPPTTKLDNGTTGKACQNDGECGKGRCYQTEGMMTYPEGYCSGSCLEDADCGAGGSCTLPTLGSGAGSCYTNCQVKGDGDCRKGYRCRTNGSRRQCLPGAAPLGDGVTGKACTADADCGGAAQSCKTTLSGSQAPEGYCSIGCSENSDCGEKGICVGGLGSALSSLLGQLGSTGVCYRGCDKTSDCRAGYECGMPTTMGAVGAAGAPPGAAAGALGNMMAASSTVCVVAPPPSASGEDAGVP